MTKLIQSSRVSLLFAGALVGLTLSACDLGPKMIGKETQGDVECKEGDKMPDADGCNTCTCLDGGWACTAKLCGDSQASEPSQCVDGETMPAPDGCNDCSCIGGAWACTEKACDPTTGGGESTSAGESTSGSEMTAGDEGETGVGETVVVESSGGETSMGGVVVCGDGIVGGGEVCDDGNLVDDDGCPNDCGIGQNVCGPKDPLTIASALIEGDLLVVEVSYGGGCETHDIGLCWDGSFAESDPVQIWVDLSHDAHADPCDAIVQEQRTLDLEPEKLAWQQSYQSQHGTILIHLDGWDDALEYTF